MTIHLLSDRRRSVLNQRIATLFVLGWIALAPTPAFSQVRDSESGEDTPPAIVDQSATRAPTTSAGRIGERQTREAVRAAGIEPMARINNRVVNRVQSRLSTSLDRNYSERPSLR